MNIEEMLRRERDRPAPNVLVARTGGIVAQVRRRRRARAAVGGVVSVATVAVIAAIAWQVVPGGPRVGVATTPSATISSSATASPAETSSPSETSSSATASPSETSSPAAPPIDTTAWTAFRSDRYGVTIGHPADWTVTPADHDWTPGADGADWPSTGFETFVSPTRDVAASVWAVAAEPGTTIEETSAGVQGWVEQYCEQTNNRPCTGIGERAVPLCNESRDCHPGLLVAFEDDVQAFFTGGTYQHVMVVVAVWRPEDYPLAQYGGSRRLLEAFLSTMDVSVRHDQPLPSPAAPGPFAG